MLPMKKQAVCVGMFILGVFCLPWELKAEEKPLSFFGQVEYWGKGDAHKEEKEDMINGGTDISDGFGVRAGIMSSLKVPGVKIGGSLGYVKGPGADSNDVTHPGGMPLASETFSSSTDMDFFRVLIEAQKAFELNPKIEFRVRGGAGVARGRLKNHATDVFRNESGVITGEMEWNDTESWTGFTGEISPSFAFNLGGTVLDIGLVYAWFPTHKESEEFYKVKWQPFGLRLGVEF